MDHSHSTSKKTTPFELLILLLDGMGLALILACTVFDTMDLWEQIFGAQFMFNPISLCVWFIGHISQMLGLLLLISHAATFQQYHNFEFLGMAFLTIGPLLNLFSCSFIKIHNVEGSHIFRRKWMISELLEITGILILDLSLIDTKEYLVLSAEVIGFAILALASDLNLIYPAHDLSRTPIMTLKTDMISVVDCFGLFLLTLVAIAQYNTKIAQHSKLGYGLVSDHPTKSHEDVEIGFIGDSFAVLDNVLIEELPPKIDDAQSIETSLQLTGMGCSLILTHHQPGPTIMKISVITLPPSQHFHSVSII